MASEQASTSALPPANGSASNGEDGHPPEGRHLTILYMTQTGTSADLAQRIARQALRKRFTITLSDISSYDPTELVAESLVLFLVSTTGQGEFPIPGRTFWNFLLRKGIPEDILSDLNFAAFGLGDTTYPRFCWPVRLLSRRLKGLGAREIVEHGEGDEMHYLGLEGELEPWLEKFWGRLDEKLPLEDGVREIGRDELLPPSTRIEKVEGRQREAESDEGDRWNRHLQEQGWSMSKLGKNERMTAADHFQDVRLLEFDESSTTLSLANDENPEHLSNGNGSHHPVITSRTFRPGDVLCLHPVNDPQSVSEILSRLGLSPSTHVTLSGPTVPSTVPQHPRPITIESLFTHHLDFTAVPTRSFFDQIRLFSPSGSLEREKLDEYCGIYPPEALAKGDINPQDGIDEMFEYAQRPRRTIKEVLEEFKSVQIPLEYLADVIPWIKPREFSIASPPPRNCSEEAEKGIELSVAIVKYKTRLRKARTGLCTRWLASLPVGTEVPILLKEGYLTLPPPDASLILIGPGTGCAPLRSLVLDRLSLNPTTEIHLFLGFRYRHKDYLFGQDWDSLAAAHPNNLHLHTAFSRDGESKTYVQDLIADDATSGALWDAIVQRNAWIIVAGASGKMPEQVRGAFEKVAQKQGGMDEDQAKRFMDSLERQKRWQEECWS